MNEPDKIPVKLGNDAFWDSKRQYFRVPVEGNPEFAALAILRDAPLPLAHLDSSAHDRSTPLGENLHRRLEDEVNVAIRRGGRQVATGLLLLTPVEMETLEN
jgi:hypothetical protein